MTFRDTSVHTTVLAVTALFVALSLWQSEQMASVQYALLAIGTILIGIPHGATDNYLYARLVGGRETFRFYAVYLLIAILYGGFWLIAPVTSLVLFLLISVYHFGQSNLFYADVPEHAGVKKLIYLPWGAFNLAAPLLFRYQKAAAVIEFLIGFHPLTVEAAHRAAPGVTGALLTVNIVILTVLYRTGRLSGRSFAKELLAFVLLTALYATAPLYVSFIVYWAFWHSLNSAIEIASTWRNLPPAAQLRRFFRAALPLSLVTFAGMAVIFLAAGVYGSAEALIGTFFAIIAAITLPHTVVMEFLYRRREETSA